MRPGSSFYRALTLVQKSMMGQLTSIDATRLLECTVLCAVKDAKATITQSSTLGKGQSIADGKILEECAIFETMRLFALKAVRLTRFLLLVLSRARFSLVLGAGRSVERAGIPPLLLCWSMIPWLWFLVALGAWLGIQ